MRLDKHLGRPPVKGYELKKSFRVPAIDILLQDIKSDMTRYSSLQDLTTRVIKQMNIKHDQFLKELCANDSNLRSKQAQKLALYRKQYDVQPQSDSQHKKLGNNQDSPMAFYEISMNRKKSISIKCTRKNCRFRVYFRGDEVDGSVGQFTNIMQRVPYYVSWHSYPLH